jgi:hypothetical protein
MQNFKFKTKQPLPSSHQPFQLFKPHYSAILKPNQTIVSIHTFIALTQPQLQTCNSNHHIHKPTNKPNGSPFVHKPTHAQPSRPSRAQLNFCLHQSAQPPANPKNPCLASALL